MMLFLAVFCGFLAEYQLEHKIEKDREKEYISSLLSDVKADSVLSDKTKKYNILVMQNIDTLLQLLQGEEIIKNSYRAYSFWKKTDGLGPFIPSDGTMTQLKNSGGLRLIKSKAVVQSIISYYREVKKIEDHVSAAGYELNARLEKKFDFFNYKRLHTEPKNAIIPLLDASEKMFSWAYGSAYYFRESTAVYSYYLELLDNARTNLFLAIKENYGIE